MLDLAAIGVRRPAFRRSVPTAINPRGVDMKNPVRLSAFRSRSLWCLFGVLIVGLHPTAATAQIVVDQSNLATTGYIINEYYTNDPASANSVSQSFIPSMNNIVGAYVEIYPTIFPDTVTMTVYDVNPAINATNPLAFGSTVINSGGGGLSIYWNPIAVTPGNTYYLRIQDSVGGNQIDLTGNAVAIPGIDQYPNGAMWVGTSVWSGGGYSDWDLVFKTYANASFIPEPSTYAALAGLGVLGFAAYRRRRGPAA